MVIAVHTSLHVPVLTEPVRFLTAYGQMGVPLFFVASALTLCISVDRRQTEPHAVMAFYIRRYFRIAPLYYLAIPVYLTLASVAHYLRHDEWALHPRYTLLNIGANLLFVHDLVPAAQNDIVPGGWSIGVEMLFYVMFPFLFRLFATKQVILRLVLALVITTGINLYVQILLGLPVKNGSFSYFIFINHFPVFIVGIGYYVAGTNGWTQSLGRPESILIFLVFTLAATITWYSAHDFAFVALPVLSAFAFVGLIHSLRLIKRHSRLLIWIGQLSYSMYITHFAVTSYFLPMMLKTFREELLRVPAELKLTVTYITVVSLTVLLAIVAERFIERPGISVGRCLITRMQNRPMPAETH